MQSTPLQTITIETTECRWFALCETPTTTARHHPLLRYVPICDRCQAKGDALGWPGTYNIPPMIANRFHLTPWDSAR